MDWKLKMSVCPFCGNTHSEEFAIMVSTRLQGTPTEYRNYNAACSCGALGPDGDTAERAVERWNDRRGIKQ